MTVTLSGGQGASTTTDLSGNYSFSGLSAGGSFTVTPTLFNYSFSPTSQVFSNIASNQTANFTASATGNNVVVSGSVTVGGVGLSGVTIELNGATNMSTITDSSGNYATALAVKGVTYTLSSVRTAWLQLQFAGHDFSNLSANQTANFTGIAARRAGVLSGHALPVGRYALGVLVPGYFRSAVSSLVGGMVRSFAIPSNTACGIPATGRGVFVERHGGDSWVFRDF